MQRTENDSRRRLCAIVTFICLICFTKSSLALDFETYRHTTTFHFPTIAEAEDQGPVVFDNLSDGRLLGVSTLITDFNDYLGSPKVYLETTVGSRSFQLLGDLPLPSGTDWSGSGAAFLTISSGQSGPVRIAVGNNDTSTPFVGVFTEIDVLANGVGGMSIEWYGVNHFSAAWLDDRHLALNSGAGYASQVRLLDTDSPTTAPVNPLILDGVEGASGGVGFDPAQNLYVSNGFEDETSGGSQTGDIKKYDASTWQAVLSGATPLDFETEGTTAGQILSGGSLIFDREDNLLVGGSNYFGGGQADFFAVVSDPTGAPTQRNFDPDESATSFYALSYNEVTHELYANQPFALDFPANIDNTEVFVIEPIALGDMNADGMVDEADVSDFVLALTDRDAFNALHEGVDAADVGDIDGDGSFDLGDVGPFKSLLSSAAASGSPAGGGLNSNGRRSARAPEPAGCAMLIAALALFLLHRRRR